MTQQNIVELWDTTYLVRTLNAISEQHKLHFAEMTFLAGWLMVADNLGYDSIAIRNRCNQLSKQVDPDLYYADIKTQAILEAMGYGPKPLGGV